MLLARKFARCSVDDFRLRHLRSGQVWYRCAQVPAGHQAFDVDQMIARKNYRNRQCQVVFRINDHYGISSLELLTAVERSTAVLKEHGIMTVTSLPGKFTADVINGYLDVKARHLL